MKIYYAISTDVLCNFWKGHNDKAIREVIAEFLKMSGKCKDTTELYKDFLSRRDDAEKKRILSQLPDRDKWEKEKICTKNCYQKMVSQLEEMNDQIHDDDFNWNDYYFFSENTIFNITLGVILNQSVKVDINCESHKEFFLVFFSFILSKAENPETFLKSHLEETFKNDPKKYKRFLVLALEKHPEYLSQLERTIDLWIDDELNNNTQINNLTQRIETKEINIPEKYVFRISDSFRGLVEDQNALNLVLSGVKIETKLQFKGNAKRLVGIFYTLIDCGLVADPRPKVITWLINSFQYTQNAKPKNLRASTTEKYLARQSNPSNKPLAEIEKLAKEYRNK